MAAYFQKSPWTPFVHAGTTYDLSHLDEYEFSVIDADAQERRITITFSDHCFTRDPVPSDDPALFYPDSDRRPGAFCFTRYQHSLGLVGYIAHATQRKVWIASDYHETFAIVPIVDQVGQMHLYAIIFSLDRVYKVPQIDLHMRIRSAYPCDQKQLATFGEIGFQRLIALRMKNKAPVRNNDQHRKKPRRP
jgi:hypothetical protein